MLNPSRSLVVASVAVAGVTLVLGLATTSGSSAVGGRTDRHVSRTVGVVRATRS
jgi:hypothetical protein